MRGKLKIYLGYAAGVGKTYRMLEEAQEAVHKGLDIVVGYFEPHGRQDTIAKSEGLETIPRKRIDYRGSAFEEIDTEKIRREVSTLKESAPDFEPVDHARTLVRRTAIRCAAAGAMSGLPSGLIALGTLGADLAYLMFQQFRLIIGIATIYGAFVDM